MSMLDNLKTFFPSLASSERKSGSESDILSNALYLYLLSLEDTELKDTICTGINFSIQELNKLLSNKNLSYVGNIDLNRNYVIKPGYILEEEISQEKIDSYVNEIRIHLKKLEDLKNPNPTQEDPPENTEKTLEKEFNFSISPDTIEGDNPDSNKETIFKESTDIGNEAKIEDILSTGENEDDALDIFAENDDEKFSFPEEEEEELGDFSLDKDYSDDDDIIDLHDDGDEGEFIQEDSISGEDSLWLEKKIKVRLPSEASKKISKKIETYLAVAKEE